MEHLLIGFTFPNIYIYSTKTRFKMDFLITIIHYLIIRSFLHMLSLDITNKTKTNWCSIAKQLMSSSMIKIKIKININFGVKLYFHIFIALYNYSHALEKKKQHN